jgi:hypothetical protein
VSTNLEWLQRFYLSLCNDDWEHSYGCTIDNVDNPGWSLKFQLTDTVYEDLDGPDVAIGRGGPDDDHEWLFLRKTGPLVEGSCGPLKLDEMIGKFREWIELVEPQAAAIEKRWQIDNA